MLPYKESSEKEFSLTCDCKLAKHGRGISRCDDYGKPYVLRKTADDRIVMVLEPLQGKGIVVVTNND